MGTLAVIPAQSAAWRVKAATELAAHAKAVLDGTTECPVWVTHAIVRACCPHLPDEAVRMRLWGEYLHCVEQETGILGGLIGWQEIDAELLCADRTQAAIEIAGELSVQALEALTGRGL